MIFKNYKFFLACLLGSTFFLFTDNRYHGWSDTHHFQLEAKAWSHGERPPLTKILQSLKHPQSVGPTHTPPFVTQFWSFFIDKNDHRQTLTHLTTLQAFLLFSIFIIFVYLAGNKSFTWTSLFWGILLFFHSHVRSWVFMPMTEPLSLFLLTITYLIPITSGITTGLQLATRPPVILLQLSPLLPKLKNRFVRFSSLITFLILAFYYKELLLPSKFQELGFSWNKSWITIQSFFTDSALLLKRALPYEESWVQILWGLIVIVFVFYLLLKNYKLLRFWLLSILYIIVIFLPQGEGFRYCFPFFVALFLETKPQIRKNKVLIFICWVFAIHLVIQQIQAAQDLRNMTYVESDSPGLQKLRTEISKRFHTTDTLMMFRYRLCMNYFDRPCIPTPSNFDDLMGDVAGYNVKAIIINDVYWQIEENAFRQRLLKKVPSNQIESFDNILLIQTKNLK